MRESIISRMKKTKLLYILVWLIIPVFSYATGISYPTVIQKYNMQNGLSNDVVYDICRDDDGCMWFATAEGISKFNGSEFSTYNWTTDLANTPNSLAIQILYYQKKLYIGTTFGLVIYDEVYNSFKLVLPDKVGNTRIRALGYASDGNIWVGLYGAGGVYKYDIKKNKFILLKYHYTDNRILSVYEDKQGFLYIGTHFGGLDVVNLRTGKSRNYFGIKAGMPDKQVENIYEDSFGNIWLATWKGLVLYNRKTGKLSIPGNKLLNSSQVNAIVEDKNGNLWVGTENGLVNFNIREYMVSPDNFKINNFVETRDEYGLSYKTVLSLLCDPDNNLWICTHSGGVNFISYFKSKFFNLIYDTRVGNSLSYRRVTTVSEDKSGNLWIGTDGGGVNYYDKTDNKIVSINKNNSNLPDNAILSTLVDSDGDIWLGTYRSTLNRKIKGRNDFIVYNGLDPNSKSIAEGDVICLEEDAYKRIWIGQRSGLIYYDKKQNKFVKVHELDWNAVKCLFATRDGIFIGAQPGVQFYNFITNKIESENTLLSNLFANSFYVDRKNNLWIGTNGQGLFCYNLTSKNISNFNQQSGFPSNYICKIIEDDDQNLWITSTKGISKFSLKNNKVVRNFNSKDGVQPGMFIENSGTKTASGLIVFGGNEGVTIFNPADLTVNITTPKLIFTNFSLFNNPVKVRSENNPESPLIKNINCTDEIELKYNESVFSIEYTSVNYLSTNQISYAYILEGADHDWNYVKDKKVATYRYLSPGKYTFKVMASDIDGNFDKSEYRVLKIVILPPFYLTWWAYLIYLLLFVLVLYFVWDFLTVKTRAMSRIRYEQLERKKSEELHQEKLQFFTNISHELRTPLTLISAPVERLLNEEETESKKYLLTLIKRNVIRMLNNVNEIMDIRKIDHKQMNLRVKEIDIVESVNEIVELFQDVAQSKQINLEFSYQDDIGLVWFDPEFLDKILCNLLSNAFKFTGEHGEIMVNIFKDVESGNDGNLLIIEVADTGQGISQEHINRIFDRFYQVETDKSGAGGMGSGVGLHLVKSLVELHKGKISVDSKLGVGSRFTISVPSDECSYEPSEKAGSEMKEQTYRRYEHEFIPVIPENIDLKQELNVDVKNKILIVDDDIEILNYLKFELKEEYDIFLAENGKAGLEKALEIIPDIIVSDVMMPEMDGISMCRELKADVNTSHIPIILLTARGSIDDRIEGLEVGAESYIPKPFDIRHLRVRIKKLIELREKFRHYYGSGISQQPGQPAPKGLSEIDKQLLDKIIDYIKKNITDSDITGETLAEHVAMSRMSLHRKLKALTALSAGEFIRNIRLDEAKKLLEAGGLSVSEVSYEVGYSSPSYFYTCFVRKFGISPSDMIKKKS